MDFQANDDFPITVAPLIQSFDAATRFSEIINFTRYLRALVLVWGLVFKPPDNPSPGQWRGTARPRPEASNTLSQ